MGASNGVRERERERESLLKSEQGSGRNGVRESLLKSEQGSGRGSHWEEEEEEV